MKLNTAVTGQRAMVKTPEMTVRSFDVVHHTDSGYVLHSLLHVMAE